MEMRRFEGLLILVALVNFAGTGFGFYYYRTMFGMFPEWLWVFIPDSPLATLFFGVSLLMIYRGVRADVFYVVAMAQSVKYGFWTMFVILYFSEYFLAPWNRGYYVLMFVLHFGMVIQPALVIHRVRVSKREVLAGAVWLGVNDFVDYVVGTNPLVVYSFSPERVMITGVVTFAAGMVILGGLWALSGRAEVFERFWRRVLGESVG